MLDQINEMKSVLCDMVIKNEFKIDEEIIAFSQKLDSLLIEYYN